jgi:uncharacterized cupredoxin-like copper-binding protein
MTDSPTKGGYESDDADPMSVGTKVGIAAGIAVAVLVGVLGVLGALAPTSTASSAGTTVASTSAPTQDQAPNTVTVEAGEYVFKSSLTAFKVGIAYHFVVHNIGAIPHEFMLVEPIKAGAMSMEEMDSMAVGHIEDAELPAARTAKVDVTFDKPYPAGTLEMACHVGQHYQNGMRLAVVVTP